MIIIDTHQYILYEMTFAPQEIHGFQESSRQRSFQMKKFFVLLSLTLAFALVACGGKKESDEKKTDKGATAEAPVKDAPPAPKAPEAFKKPEMEEKSLESAGEAFAGWFAQGPKTASVMQDLGGVRIASKNMREPDAFDLAWSFRKPDFAQMKDSLTKGAEMGKATLTFTADTADGLEWTMESHGQKSHHFSIVFQVSEKDVNCYTMPMGAKSPEQVAFLKETCKSLVKK
jgi:hypothetical protein